MTTKFKVGSEVRIISHWDDWFGESGMVEQVGGGSILVSVSPSLMDSPRKWFHPNEIELLNEPVD